MRRSRLFLAAASALLAFAGCRKPEITTYTAPKDAAPAIAAHADVSTNTGRSAPPAIRWQLPLGWQDQGATGQRLGNILVTGPDNQRAEMTVTRFEGDVGGELANVNRWRAQLQLPPIGENDFGQILRHVDLPTGHVHQVDIVSDGPLTGGAHKTRTLVAWLPQQDVTWFFKLTGDDPLVASQRDAFAAFLRSVEFSAPSASSLPPDHPPIPAGSDVSAPPLQNAGGSMAGASLPAGTVTESSALIWTAPSGWTEKPLGPVRKGSFAVGSADLSITAFPGATGGLLANINRWRGEVQLSPIAESDLAANTQTITHDEFTFTVVDLAGPSRRTLGAILPHGADTYFFKLTGENAAVAAAKDEFLAFLATVKTR